MTADRSSTPHLRVIPPRKRSRRLLVAAVGLSALLVGLAVLAARQAIPSSAPAPVVSAGVPRLAARGQVQPVARARVGTLTGGVVERLSVEPGDAVYEQQELARVRGPAGAELLVAPFAGTVSTAPINLGDTLLPGATVATVADVARLQVETTDVDEFIIAGIHRGQAVQVFVDALDLELFGWVRSVAVEPVTDSRGDQHYPVVIDLSESGQSLRAGMSARLTFLEGPSPTPPLGP